MIANDFLLSPINEKFHGRVRNVEAIEKAIAKSREEFIGKSRITMGAYGHKSFTKIEDAIKDTFGFKVVDFDLKVDPVYNAYTFPIASSVTSAFSRVPEKAYKENTYDGTNFSLYVRVTTGMFTSPDFSDAEITAIILHEIGHNFQHINNNGQKAWGQILCISRLLAQDISIAISDTKLRASLSKKVKTSPILKAGVNIFGGISGIFKYTLYSITAALNFITLGVTNPIVSLSTINPLEMIFAPIFKGAEFNSDSFVASFGYGTELISALGKLELNERRDTGTWLEGTLKKIPILGHINNMMAIPPAIIMAPFTNHPLTGRRMNNIVNELKRELKKSDLSPAMRKEVEQNIACCEEILASYKEPRKDSLEINRKWLAGIIRRGKEKGFLSSAYGDMEESSMEMEDFSNLELTSEEQTIFRKIDSRNSFFLLEYPEVSEYDDSISTNRLDYWFG